MNTGRANFPAIFAPAIFRLDDFTFAVNYGFIMQANSHIPAENLGDLHTGCTALTLSSVAAFGCLPDV